MFLLAFILFYFMLDVRTALLDFFAQCDRLGEVNEYC